VAGVQPAQGPLAARARILQVSDCPRAPCFVCYDIHLPPSSRIIRAMHRTSFTLFLLHSPSLLLFTDACAATSWLVLLTPPSRAPGAPRPPSFTRGNCSPASHCFCGSRDEIRLDLHRTFVPLLSPCLHLYCETDCHGQLRQATGLLHAAGADLVGAHAPAAKPFNSVPASALHQCAILFSATAKVSTLWLVCFSCTGTCCVPLLHFRSS
jgi:hypothetical protein